MPLAPGLRLGAYEIQSSLGAGGMGEVYKARDVRLDRLVAIKILSDTLAADPQFRQRFDREARIISQLTHPHLCTLYDVGEQDGVAFLVMEYLQGETLAERLTKGALPIDEALKFAVQIGDALSAAHRHGVVHRDLKPGNVMITSAGAKLVDFGLAKGTASVVTGAALSTLPTTPPNLTVQGAVLGTFQYMSPEQLEGAEADARTDIFAFGCVLYEMLVGRKAFEGKTQASLIAAIMEREPTPVVTLQPLIPALLDSVVRKCLAKNADDRWQNVADLTTALRWAAGGTATAAATTTVAGTPKSRWTRAAFVGAFAALGLIAFAAGALTWRYLSNVPLEATSSRFEILPPPGALWTPAPVASAAQLTLSPDGRRLAFVAARRGGISQLWVRPLDRVEAQPLAGTDGASFPFWSPDSRFLGFFAAGKLRTIDTAGGGPQPLADAASGRGGSWNRDGIIIFSASPNGVILRIAASGGPVTEITKLDDNVFGHNWPQFLPDGRHFLFYHRAAQVEHQGVYVGSLDSSTITRVLQSGSMAMCAGGQLLFSRDGMLFAQPFDERSLQTTGEPVRIADHVGYFTAAFGYVAVTASRNGILVFGPGVALTTSLRWLDRTGASTGVVASPAFFSSPRLSPDEKNIAVAITDAATPNRDIWVIDVARGSITSRATFDDAADWFPTWGPDGARMFFGSTRPGSTSIFQKIGTAPDELLYARTGLNGSGATYPNDASSDGKLLLYTQSSSGGYDLGILPLSGDRKPVLFHATPFNEAQGRFSPNTRWIAYTSDESGAFEIYVRRFPSTNEQWRVSSGGGTQPQWRRDGRELFYVSAERRLMAVPVTIDRETPVFGASQALFPVEIPEVSAPYPVEYAVSADGKRFLVNTVVEQTSRPTLTVVLSWQEELKQRAPTR